ncbi:MAG: hypothetical protein KDC82_06255, partial [Bacteroidetes bacterium]|nr:hypothetical protein [Bacteroidota bacterium]
MKFKINYSFVYLLYIVFPLVLISSCKDDAVDEEKVIVIKNSSTAADEAQMAFIEVEEGYTIQFEGGTYDFTNTLSMDGKTNIVIKGAGREVTYLDFSGQTAGGEGVLVTNSANIRFENLSIIDATGDALIVRDCDRISFVGVGTI